MKRKFFIATLLLASLILFLVNAYAHYQTYGKEDVKVETKKIDKGIQITITSDDPEVANDIQENTRYYEDILAYSDNCPHMERMAYHRHGCMW